MEKEKRKAVVLLSGGLDSATIMAIVKKEDYQIYALSFNYGQRHKIELEMASKIAILFAAKEHKIAQIDLRIFGGSALTADIEVPKNQLQNKKPAKTAERKTLNQASSNPDKGLIPITYVPARNTIFLSYAIAYAEVIGAGEIFIGVNAIDYSGYPDCRPTFIKAFEKMANLATATALGGNKIKIQTPLINLSKKEIIKKGLDLGVNYAFAHSCYDPILKDEKVYACGGCDSCQLRLAGFVANEIEDPYQYLRKI